MSRREGQRQVPAAPLPRALLGSNPVLGLRSRLGFFSRDRARGQGCQPWAPGAAGGVVMTQVSTVPAAAPGTL